MPFRPTLATDRFRQRVRLKLRAINWQTALVGLGLFVVFVAAMGFAQFSTADMPDNDGYYHIRMAEIMRREGWKPHFDWLPLTILNPREFYDHHFLFHVALIPFTFGDLRAGAKWAAVIFAALSFLTIWWFLHKQRIRYSWLWALGTLAVSHAFLYRMSITRAQSLSLLVLVLGLHWMLTGRYVRLLGLGFVYAWMYNAFPLLPVFAVVYSAAVLIIERRLELRPVLYSGAGVLLGIFINPYFPADLVFIYRHLLPKLVETTEVRVGNEWYPYTTQQLLENSLFALAAFGSGALALGLQQRRMDVRTAAALLVALLTGLMMFQSRRFIEYFPPFALIFAALAWNPLLETLPEPGLDRRRWPGLLAPAALAGLVAVGALTGLPALTNSLGDSKSYTLYAGAANWLEDNTRRGERIFQTDWDDFPRLFYYNIHNTYTIGLDPTYMQLYDPELYDTWVKITQGEMKNPAEVIRTRFGARYILSDLLHGNFISAAQEDPDLVEVYRDQQAVIFAVQP